MSVVLVSVPHGFSAGNMLRTGLVQRILDSAPAIRVVLASPLADDAAFVREFAHPRVQFEDAAAASPRRPRGAAARADSGVLYRLRRHRVGADPPRRKRSRRRAIRWIRAKRRLARGIGAVDGAEGDALRARAIGSSRIRGPSTLFDRYRPALLVTSSPGLILRGGAAAADGGAPRRAVDGRRSELGQLHQQAPAGPPRQSPHRLERADEAAGDRRCTATSPTRCASPVRRSGISISGGGRDIDARRVLPPHRRRSVAQAGHADDDAASSSTPITTTCFAC